MRWNRTTWEIIAAGFTMAIAFTAFTVWVVWEDHKCRQVECPPGTKHMVVLSDGCYCVTKVGR